MDFRGLITIDGLVNPSSIHAGGDAFSSSSSSSHTDKRSGFLGEKLDWRSFKMAKSEAPPPPSPLPDRGQFLGFSASEPEALLPTSTFIGNAGLNVGKSDFGCNGLSVGNRGGIFTPSQWMELENQALIYKYIDASTEIPANLLTSTRRSFNPFGLSFSTGSLRTAPLDRGSYHVGLCGNADPEPGRCRRTDGKKWRCSREAVADQKYCERHLNRGRHRSRKPVEGHINMSMIPAAAITTSRAASAATCGSGATNKLTTTQQQQMTTFNSSTTQINRTTTLSDMKDSTCSKDSEELCKLTLLNSSTCSFPNPKQNQIDKLSSSIKFGFISTCSPSLQLGVNEKQLQPDHVLQQFTWSEGEDIKTDDNYELPTPDGMSPRTTSGMPFIWDKYAGGPLAEALKNTGKAQDHDKKSSLDLIIDNWDMSPWTGSSSTNFDSVSGSTITSSSKQKCISSMLSHDFN